MQEYLYSYQSITRFSRPVWDHSYLLRCEPYRDSRQTPLQGNVTIFPVAGVIEDSDCWGSSTRHGFLEDAHDKFGYISTGIVRIDETLLIEESNPGTIYRMPSLLTTADPGVKAILPERGNLDDLDYAYLLLKAAHESIEYTPLSTNARTTAAEALAGGHGVCQDYAHIMLSLCREAGIKARYVCGLVPGEGQTHAWVEVHAGGLWHPMDPTSGKIASEGYIKIAHGRDAADCPVNRGVYKGLVSESTETKVIVERIK